MGNSQFQIELVTECESKEGFLPKIAGNNYCHFEFSVYDWMNYLCSEYNGGCWEFYSVNNTGGFMAPCSNTPFHLQNPDNHFDGEVSAEAAGIIVSILAYTGIIEESKNPGFLIGQQDLLKNYAQTHPESSLIFQAID